MLKKAKDYLKAGNKKTLKKKMSKKENFEGQGPKKKIRK